MNNEIGPADEWEATLFTIMHDTVVDHTKSLDYTAIRTAALRWLKEKKLVRFGLKCRASNREMVLDVEQCGDLARVNVDGDLVTFGDAVCIMQEMMGEEASG
jgi:hypothetical protein